MNLSHPFIVRPVATTLLTIGIVLLGFLGYRALPISALPSIDFPTIEVTSTLPGASPDVMAAMITTPLEHGLGQITGLTSMNSVSAYGTSQIALQFELGRDIDVAAQDVQAQLNAVAGLLPLAKMPGPPVYNKVNPADTPIMILAVTSETLPLRTITDMVTTVLAQKLSQVDGVGLVSIEGNQKPAIRIQADASAMAGLNLSLEDLRAAIGQASIDLPKGTLDGPRQSYQIAANDQLLSAGAYEPVIVAYRNGAPVRVKDVARVIDDVENSRLAGWYDGRRAIVVNIQRQPGANIIATVGSIRALLPKLQASLPPAVKIHVLTDRTGTIRASISDVQMTLIFTALLVVAVIFLFLRNGWATVTAGVSLPVSVIATFGVMVPFGFSIDNLSLMALTIASGFVVDDAIVMIENIVRHREAGETPLLAALKGARQIGFTVVSLSCSLVAVFLPLLLMGGVVGRLFREFSVTLSTAVVISAVVSLTLTPMMCAHLLTSRRAAAHGASRPADRFGAGLLHFYERGLRWVLRHQGAVLLLTLLTMAASVWLYVAIPKGFLPQQDTGLIVGTTDAAQDISFAAMMQRQQAVAAAVRRDPDVLSVDSFIGAGVINASGSSGRLYINLKPHEQRKASADEIMARLRRATAPILGITLSLQSAQDLQIETRESRTQYQYTLQDADAAELSVWASRLLGTLRHKPQLADVTSDQQTGGLQQRIAVDRDAAARLGVTMQAIDDALYDAFGQRQISTLYSQVNQYRVILEADPSRLKDNLALASIWARSTTGALVPLNVMAQFTPEAAPTVVTHSGLFPSATISFNVPPGGSLGESLQAIAQAETDIGLPTSIARSFGGSAGEFRASLGSEPLLIAAAIVTVYIVLGVLYESFIHPITILSTLPSAGVGALLALMCLGYDLNVISLIGIILLIGIVKKNAIMMIDFAVEATRTQGLSAEAAIVRACLLRFRPIMMTTMAALIGALPMALGSGTGSELRRPLGITIVGGLLVSQLLTLYTTPVVYLAIDRLRVLLRPATVRLAAEPAIDASLGVAAGE